MRKLTRRHLGLLRKRARLGTCPRRSQVLADGRLPVKAEREQARLAFAKWSGQFPSMPTRVNAGERLRITTPPKVLDLTTNYRETMGFLLAVRDSAARSGRSNNRFSRWRGLLDLAAIENLDPATGLVLAAELDRWRSRDIKAHQDTWHENVRRQFEDSGLFELLGLRASQVTSKPPLSEERLMLRYRRGEGPDGRQADELRGELERLVGARFGPRVAINNALAEAMTNSHHHAYPEDARWWPKLGAKHWWASGAYAPSTGTIHMMVYDRGVGIPQTLPRSRHWASAIPILDRFDPERTDAGLIEAALELRRTSTHIGGRGRGLYEMAEWIDRTGSGFLRIMSGKGAVIYRPGGAKERTKLPAAFCGTLVEWEIRHGS